ncbi:MAG: hypothetical protein HOE48_13735 [Candidatus Latescibacteria bacterium]|jgi:hypothetical protein|nr:hypothetical protein [Candidatus Latescibacterota bacterium]MBT4138976.1 hypothetical protein [Candidatus Latescibacterota bacterium]MBT5829836.1 hypothetical protein [Candidatus Latescibacterota bacterium]
MSTQDRQLAVLYWELQRKVHTNPKMRVYLNHVSSVLKQRNIRPSALNAVGLEEEV